MEIFQKFSYRFFPHTHTYIRIRIRIWMNRQLDRRGKSCRVFRVTANICLGFVAAGVAVAALLCFTVVVAKAKFYLAMLAIPGCDRSTGPSNCQ